MTRASLLVLSVMLAACVDFGYRVPDPPAAADGGVVLDSGESCVEEVVTPSASGPQVHLVTLNVDQPVLNVVSGDVVTWTNTDTMHHTVTAGVPGAPLPPAQGGFDSGDLAPDGAWAFRFCEVRTAVYFCATHPSQMNNFRVIVGP